jgi:hypothetical protein
VYFRAIGRALAAVLFVNSLSACSAGGSSAVPPHSGTPSASSSQRHASVTTVTTGNGDGCGACDCGNDQNNNGSLIPTDGTNQCNPGSTSTNPSSNPGSGPVIVDMGPGRWTEPQQPDCVNDPTNAACQVAVVSGIPNGKCQQTDGADSLGVGTTLGSVNKDGDVSTRNVIDINQVNALASQTIANNQTVVNNWVAVGWIYLDNNGGLWFQKDPLSQWTVTFNANINAYFGISVTPPSAQNPVYIKNPPKAAPIANNLQTVKCFSKGRALVPGTLGMPTVSST